MLTGCDSLAQSNGLCANSRVCCKGVGADQIATRNRVNVKFQFCPFQQASNADLQLIFISVEVDVAILHPFPVAEVIDHLVHGRVGRKTQREIGIDGAHHVEVLCLNGLIGRSLAIIFIEILGQFAGTVGHNAIEADIQHVCPGLLAIGSATAPTAGRNSGTIQSNSILIAESIE